MVLDESTLERMLAAGKAGKEFQRPPAKLLDANDEFEVYERAAPQGERETVREDPPPDLEEYPPRRHAEGAPAPAPTAQEHVPPTPPAPPTPPTPSGPAPEQAPPPHAPAPPAPSHPAPAPPPTPPATEAVPPPSHAPAPAPAPDAPAPPPAPSRPQVFSLNRPRPQADRQAAPSASPPAPGRSEGPWRIALVQADYNADITDLMAQWAIKHAQQQGAEIVCHLHVPGVFDVPLTSKLAARRPDVDAVVVVGAVVQGETGHDELIAREAARLLADLAFETEKPVGLGIAGPRMTMEQAEARIKMGRNAVESVLRQLQVLQQARA